MKHLLSISSLLLLLLLLLVPFSTSDDIAPTPTPIPTTGPTTGVIYRATKQQILATIPPGSSAPQPFLTSPSGKYTAYLLRTPTALGAGGFGNDFCYIQIQETETNQGLWESECAPISTSNACTLVFDDAGLEVFDGPNSVYNTQADGDHVNTLELVDQGDMRVIDKQGELSWKASDEPRSNQGCGLPGSVGLAPDSPPFAGVIGGPGNGQNGPFGQPATGVIGGPGNGQNGPFGQPATGVVVGQRGRRQQPAADEEMVGGGDQPLVDDTAYNSGSLRVVLEVFSGFGVAVPLFVCGLFVV